MKKSLITLSLAALFLTACDDKQQESAQPASDKAETEVATKPAQPQASGKPQNSFLTAYDNIDLAQFKERVKTMSTDDFQGRSPATDGGRKTVEFLTSEFKKLGLEPGNGDSYLQQVPLTSIEADANMELQLGDNTLKFPEDFVANSSKLVDTISLDKSELVFVGFGTVAPEYNWNDYEGLDMEGKTAVILVNDPGYHTQDPELFQGKAMTYYGRWTYKYEEAARQGAAAAIVIHDTAPASYGWNVVSNSWSGPQYHLAEAGDDPKLDVEMWITYDQAQNLFSQAGLDLNELQEAALKPDFKAVPIDATASVTVRNTIEKSQSPNVIATIPGKTKPDEHVVYMAHWDHLGMNPHLEGDQIFNGAVDNATGTAGIISIAQAFKALPEQPERSVTFIAVTAEEQGLLGSKYYAANPTVPMNKIVGAFNIDSMNISGRVTDLTVVGFGKSEMETYVSQAAERQGRELVPEASPERGGYYRSDHFSLAKLGVPAIYAGGGTEYREGQDMELIEQHNKKRGECYHQVCDEYQENWAWEAALDDVKVFFEAGYLLSNSGDYPNWYEGTEFKAIRDESMAK
ncbi:M28 family peptidase [Kangiella sp.]|uniref:M28 family peptidase n=1 Tax=Kangiella sp. TaxID=1920245 RepID=UPI003A8DE44C